MKNPAMNLLSGLRQRKPGLFASLLLVAGLLVYIGTQIGIDTRLQFNAAGYSYLYYGGAHATDRFVVADAFSDKEREVIAGYLRQANLLPSDSTQQKIIKLAEFILDRIDDTRGVPERSWYAKNTYDKFQMVWNKQLSGIFCTQFRLVYTVLANAAGIPTRVVHSRVLRGPWTDEVKEGEGISGHNFSESYIREADQWAHVDLNEKIILLRNTKGKFINTADLYDIMMGYREGEHFELTSYDSSTQTIQQWLVESRVDLADFFSERTAYAYFFQDHEMFFYEKNGRGPKYGGGPYLFRPYLATHTVGTRSYALAGLGVSLASVSCVYFLWPRLSRIRYRLRQSA